MSSYFAPHPARDPSVVVKCSHSKHPKTWEGNLTRTLPQSEFFSDYGSDLEGNSEKSFQNVVQKSSGAESLIFSENVTHVFHDIVIF